MKVNVKILRGEEYNFDVSPSETVFQVKQKIYDRLGIEIPHQCLLLMGKTLADENEISFYPGIKEGSRLTLVKKSTQSSISKAGLYKFKEEVLKVLRTYYSDADALTIANETIKDLQNKVNHLSYDDLERLATALIQEQENAS